MNAGPQRAWRAPNNQQASYLTCSAIEDFAAKAGCDVTALACLRFEPALGWPAFFAWCVTGAALFAAIDYHWGSRPGSSR